MTTLTYEDLLSIREALTERQGTKQGLLRKVDSLIEDERQYRSLDTMRPNAETLAAMEEARNWQSLPSAKTLEEFWAAMDAE